MDMSSSSLINRCPCLWGQPMHVVMPQRKGGGSLRIRSRMIQVHESCPFPAACAPSLHLLSYLLAPQRRTILIAPYLKGYCP
jgi:hypothetical protein